MQMSDMANDRWTYMLWSGIVYLLINTHTVLYAAEPSASKNVSLIPTNNEYTYGYEPVNFNLADAKDNDVIFHLYSPTYKEGVYLNGDNNATNIDTDLATKFLIHGWGQNEMAEFAHSIRKEYSTKGDYNIILVDWSRPAGRAYSISAANTKPVGFAIADMIMNFKFNLAKVHLIGFSLGSHVAGFAGKKVCKDTGSKISRITATDAARPAFEHHLVGLDSRLSPLDAVTVDVIHTDTGHYGFIRPIGTVDFYFNGGKTQAGCPPLRLNDDCHHSRSHRYFAESIKSNDFVAAQCLFSANPVENKIFPVYQTIFGENMPRGTYGVYCLGTGDKSPFALGSIGEAWVPIFAITAVSL